MRDSTTRVKPDTEASLDTRLTTVKQEEDFKERTVTGRCLRLKTTKIEVGEGTVVSLISTTAVTAWRPRGVEKKVRKKIQKIEKKKRKRVPAGVSVRPWPPLTSEKFGIIQEELAHDPFQLIVAAIFLNRTRGSVAKPVLLQCLATWPTPEKLSQAPFADLKALLQPLGLQNIRAARLIALAENWLAYPPIPFLGAKKYNYPARDTIPFSLPNYNGPKWGIRPGRGWEIGHLPGIGAYALDSWRIFCCDKLRGNEDMNEWRRVVPKDKELRAYCRWRWAKEGIKWKEPADELMEVNGRDFIREAVDQW